MKKRIILVGRAASGKDHLRKLLESKNLVYATSYTTRPPRTGEVDGKDYFFISPDEFKLMIEKNEWYEYVIFNTWYYGTTNKQFYHDGDILIMTPAGLSHVKGLDREQSLVIYLDMPEDVRRQRIALRNDADSAERRIAADNIDFKDFNNFDIHVTNPDFTIEQIISEISKFNYKKIETIKSIEV